MSSCVPRSSTIGVKIRVRMIGDRLIPPQRSWYRRPHAPDDSRTCDDGRAFCHSAMGVRSQIASFSNQFLQSSRHHHRKLRAPEDDQTCDRCFRAFCLSIEIVRI